MPNTSFNLGWCACKSRTMFVILASIAFISLYTQINLRSRSVPRPGQLAQSLLTMFQGGKAIIKADRRSSLHDILEMDDLYRMQLELEEYQDEYAPNQKTWTDMTGSHVNDNETRTLIAVGGGITSMGIRYLRFSNVRRKFVFFNVFLPSFCKTASVGFTYHFYFAYDQDDAFFTHPALLNAFKAAYEMMLNALCPRGIRPELHLMQCAHSGHPAHAQNDAMMEAYLDGVDYFYRVNDDTLFESERWTEIFISILADYRPPNVGVVGPYHSGGNEQVLTYDFVHRTHLEVFGFYYPRVFTDWYADDWITRVYEPGRSTKEYTVQVTHTMSLGQRYEVKIFRDRELRTRLLSDRRTVLRYLAKRKMQLEQPKPSSSKIIAMSLYGNNVNLTYGALRNAQTIHWYFPDWILRFYVPGKSIPRSYPRPQRLVVPTRVITKLESLGAQIVYVNETLLARIPHLWHHSVIDDVTVDFFLIRSALSRFSEREKHLVTDWMKTNFTIHCIRDHPMHAKSAIVDGLWGGRRSAFRNTRQSMTYFLSRYAEGRRGRSGQDFVRDVIVPLIWTHAYCHDSVSCEKWPNSSPIHRETGIVRYYIGQKFDAYNNPLTRNQRSIYNLPSSCSFK